MARSALYCQRSVCCFPASSRESVGERRLGEAPKRRMESNSQRLERPKAARFSRGEFRLVVQALPHGGVRGTSPPDPPRGFQGIAQVSDGDGGRRPATTQAAKGRMHHRTPESCLRKPRAAAASSSGTRPDASRSHRQTSRRGNDAHIPWQSRFPEEVSACRRKKTRSTQDSSHHAIQARERGLPPRRSGGRCPLSRPHARERPMGRRPVRANLRAARGGRIARRPGPFRQGRDAVV